MTKGQWRNLRIGANVTTTYPDLTNIEKRIDYHGTVIRANSNGSQVLVRWDNTKTERWYGRLGIELANGSAKRECVSPIISHKQVYICSTCGNDPCVCCVPFI